MLPHKNSTDTGRTPTYSPFFSIARLVSKETHRLGRVMRAREILEVLRADYLSQISPEAEWITLGQAERAATVPRDFLLRAINAGTLPARRVPFLRKPRRSNHTIEIRKQEFLIYLAKLEERRQREAAVGRAKYLAELAVHVRERYGEKSADELLERIQSEGPR